MERAATVLKATGKPANGDAFRLDINALRAVSVAAVVGYHFQIPGFAGGFVGVDIFLVITGYLMTGKVLNDLALGRFSFITFLLMRLRRIYPALAVMIASTIVVGWFVTLPNEYLKHLLQALSALVFQSNFAFNSDNGYFAMAAQTKPLLHTWSLSLAWCLWESQNDATGSSFFALPARAWEPLAGGLVAIAELQRRSESPAKN